jgi:hypothetical protein
MGTQTINVVKGEVVRAFITSVLISSFSALSIKLIPDASIMATVCYIMGAPCGIVLAILLRSKK